MELKSCSWFHCIGILILFCDVDCKYLSSPLTEKLITRQNIPDYQQDEYSEHEKEEMYPTSNIEPAALQHDTLTSQLVNTIAGSKHKNNEDKEDYGDDIKTLNEDFDKKSLNGYGDYGDDMEESKPLLPTRTKLPLGGNINTNNLREYRKYPNEAVEKEYTGVVNKRFPTIVNFRDALTADTNIISKELKFIESEDTMIKGSVKDTDVQPSIKKNVTKSVVSIDKGHDEDLDMDKVTKELLNIDVGANGKILDGNTKRIRASKESILPTKPQGTELIKQGDVDSVGSKSEKNTLTDDYQSSKVDFADVAGQAENLSQTFDTARHVKKAMFTPIYDRDTPLTKEKINPQNFNKMQNEILQEMFKVKNLPIKRKTLQGVQAKKSNQGDMNDIDLKKFQSMRKKNSISHQKRHVISKQPIRRKERRQFVPHGEGFVGAISYTDEEGRELTYTIGKDKLTYDDARRRCRRHHGDLVTIGNEKEQDFIVNNVIMEPNEYWIGLDDRSTEGLFQWVDSSQQSLYTHWGNLEPDDGTNKRRGSTSYHNEDCTVMRAIAEWSDVNCNDKYMFICKDNIKGNTLWTPIYSDAAIKTNQNIPTEDMFVTPHTTSSVTTEMVASSRSSDCTNDKIVDCRNNTNDDPPTTSDADVTPGGNGGDSKKLITEEEVGTPEINNVPDSTTSKENIENNKLAEAGKQQNNKLTGAGITETVQNNSTESVIAAPISPKDENSLKTLQNVVLNLQRNYLKVDSKYSNPLHNSPTTQIESLKPAPVMASPNGVARKDILNYFKDLTPSPSPIPLESQTNLGDGRTKYFTPDPKIIANMCDHACANNIIDGCTQSCRATITSMNPVQFLSALQNMKQTQNEIEPINKEESVKKKLIENIKGNLSEIYMMVLHQAGYDDNKHGLNNLLDQSAQVAQQKQDLPVVDVEETNFYPSKSWNLFKERMVEAYNKTTDHQINTEPNKQLERDRKQMAKEAIRSVDVQPEILRGHNEEQGVETANTRHFDENPTQPSYNEFQYSINEARSDDAKDQNSKLYSNLKSNSNPALSHTNQFENVAGDLGNPTLSNRNQFENRPWDLEHPTSLNRNQFENAPGELEHPTSLNRSQFENAPGELEHPTSLNRNQFEDAQSNPTSSYTNHLPNAEILDQTQSPSSRITALATETLRRLDGNHFETYLENRAHELKHKFNDIEEQVSKFTESHPTSTMEDKY